VSESKPENRLIVGITGATGTIYGVRLLEVLRQRGVETHLVMSRWGARTLVHETQYTPKAVQQLATHVHPITNQGAPISSGSFLTRGMIVAPCSMRTVAAIATGYGDNLLHRAADVIIKERRTLVLVVRESPLSQIHLENMLKLARMGVVICPAMPAFYQQPKTVDDIIDQTVVRVLDQVGIHVDAPRWSGDMNVTRQPSTKE
jgi:flavin prenyltransferase